MRAFVMFLVGMLIGACARPQTVVLDPPASHEAQARDLTAKTVALVMPTEEGTLRAFCSGVWVSGWGILTANHCLEGAQPGEPMLYATADDVVTGDKGFRSLFLPRDASVLAVDEVHDLALLRASEPPSHGTAGVARGVIEPGQWCQVMGHSIGLYFSYSTGDIAAIRKGVVDLGDGSEEVTWIQATAPISPGNSGGGMFDAEGQLIGIADASFRRGQSLNVFIHRDHIAAFLGQANP